ncbi:isochorismate synthase [Nocardia transvalensis]|uniref:isochorismate synthase n=1 Tax=Nocardia transvalensis TaxID=37333 RepID=A0A7W9ULD2_9NOCA|nr:isochorismate synthase [Nocardia transvalensis]MBB5917431.1 isochorismate synthase [Nocardia transvalensis]
MTIDTTRCADSALPQWISDIEASEFFLTTPRGTLLAADPVHEIDASGHTRLADLARAAHRLLTTRAVSPRPLLVGAVPFGDVAGARLAIAASVRWERSSVLPKDALPAPVSGVERAESTPGPVAYADGVRTVVERIARTDLRKVVLARALDIGTRTTIPVAALALRAAQGNPDAYVFATKLAPPGRAVRPTLIGASPELVIRKTGPEVVTNPLAGSASRSADPAEDRRRARALRRSAKDLHEHRIVIEAVADALRPYCAELRVPEPELVRTRTMWHLSTPIQGTLADPGVSSLELAAALHPTPAVCGTPTGAARELLAEIEGFDRRFYAGLTGWMDAAGDGEWILSLRCAEVTGAGARLYAGAGIVAGSDPGLELAETSGKLRTLLSVFGLEDLETRCTADVSDTLERSR